MSPPERLALVQFLVTRCCLVLLQRRRRKVNVQALEDMQDDIRASFIARRLERREVRRNRLRLNTLDG